MKTTLKDEATSRPAAAVLLRLSLLSSALLTPLRAADPAIPKDHALFAGATVRVEDGSDFLEIVGARGTSVALLADGKLRHVLRSEIRNVRVERSLKLTDVIARIDKMSATPTSESTNRDLFGDMHMQMLMSDMAFDAQSAVSSGAAGVAAASGQMAVADSTMFGGAKISPAQVVASEAPLVAASSAETTLQSQVDSFGHAVGTADDNALAIAFELSTPRILHNTYALVLTEYASAGGGKTSYNVDVEPIGDLGPKPRRVTFTQGGFPPNFVVSRVGVHLYSGGLELASNLSDSRVDLTEDDAMRYLVLAYVASHPKDSLPGAPLRIVLPANFKQQVPPADLSRTFYVTVGADGRVEGLSAESDHLVAVNPFVDSAVRKFFYKPALKEGKPVASVIAMRLDTFLR